MSAFIIIPARYNSTRLPGKLLLRETGDTLIYHTYMNALRSRKANAVCVATDSKEIFDEVRSFNGLAVMTGEYSCGTDRVIEACKILSRNMNDKFLFSKIVVNLQADEPSLTSDDIDRLINNIESNNSKVSSLRFSIDYDQACDPNRVKVITDYNNRAMYFSRYPIPFLCDLNNSQSISYFQHVGVYAFDKRFLTEDIPKMVQTDLEIAEDLEQLRWLEYGADISIETIDHATNGIDTREDYDDFIRSYNV